MDHSVWYGVFWHHLVYPELALDEIEDASLTVAWMRDAVMSGMYPDFVVCLSLDGYTSMTTLERTSALVQTKQVIHAFLPEAQRQLFGFAHGNALYFCGVLPRNDDGGECRDRLIGQLEHLQSDLCASTGLSITFGLGFLREKSIEGWRWAAQSAIVAQRRKVRDGANRVYVSDGHSLPPTLPLDTYDTLTRKLYDLVRAGDVTRVDAVLSETNRAFFQQVYLPLSHMRPLLQSQIILMAQAAREAGTDGLLLEPLTEHALEAIDTTYDYAHLQGLVESTARALTQLVCDRYQCKSNRLISETASCVAECLHDPALSLQFIAHRLDVNPSYLSRTFKRAQGIGITEYINQARVHSAKRLLLDRKLSVTEIAFLQGFGSVQHFGRVFRACTGDSPSMYRKAKNAQNK